MDLLFMKPLFFLLVLSCAALSLNAQNIKLIQLKQQHLSYATTGYYVNNVVDDRADKTSIGRMNGGGKPDKLNLQNGAAAAIIDFITKNVTQDRSKQAIIMHITRLSFELKNNHGIWNEDADVAFTFYAGDTKLIELSSKGQKQTDVEPLDYIDEFIKKALESDLRKFDTWWQQNSKKIPTASTVKVIANIGKTINKPDCIVYSLSRPLNIADFQGQPEENIVELAATLSGIGMESSGQTQNGQMVLTITLTPYFSKPGSWFKAEGKNPRVLAHEQTHFDITALNVCELISKIRNTAFSKENYEAQLQGMLSQNSENANRDEALFDAETKHGTIKDKEEEWEKKIKERIKAAACY